MFYKVHLRWSPGADQFESWVVAEEDIRSQEHAKQGIGLRIGATAICQTLRNICWIQGMPYSGCMNRTSYEDMRIAVLTPHPPAVINTLMLSKGDHTAVTARDTMQLPLSITTIKSHYKYCT